MAGPGEAIARAGTSTPLRVAQDLADQYGGDPYACSKMTSPTYSNSWEMTFSTHWYENRDTGMQTEWKMVIGR